MFIIGYLRGQCAGEVLSFTQTSGKALIQRKANARWANLLIKRTQLYTDKRFGGFGGHSGLYLIEDFGLPIKSKAKDGY